MELKHIAPLPPNSFASYRKGVTHSHFDRENRGTALCAEQLKEWCSFYHVDALGVGSPWYRGMEADDEPTETTDRDRYYAKPEPPPAERNKLERLIELLNRESRTFFYPDNETPKGRNGHLWYFNYHHTVPAWHDYSQDRPVKYYWNDPHEEQNRITGRPHFRRPYSDVIAEQRKNGALAVWAHPTSWWRDGNGQFVTNIAAEMPAHLLLDGTIDGLTVSGYDPFHRSYRELYFMLLDRGYRIPAFAEMDLTSTSLRQEEPIATGIYCPGMPGSAEERAEHARTGNCFLGNGIRIALEIDGCAMGGSIRAEKNARHVLKVRLAPAPGDVFCSSLEITGPGGNAQITIPRCEKGEYLFEFSDSGEFSYFTACAFGERDDKTKAQQKIHSFAMTNPVWLVPRNHKFPEPAWMTCTIRFRPDSPFLGGSFRIPGGEAFPALAAPRELHLPANTALELATPGGTCFRSYPFFEDEHVQSLISTLSEGKFLNESRKLLPGEVPARYFNPELWRSCLNEIQAFY